VKKTLLLPMILGMCAAFSANAQFVLDAAAGPSEQYITNASQCAFMFPSVCVATATVPASTTGAALASFSINLGTTGSPHNFGIFGSAKVNATCDAGCEASSTPVTQLAVYGGTLLDYVTFLTPGVAHVQMEYLNGVYAYGDPPAVDGVNYNAYLLVCLSSSNPNTSCATPAVFNNIVQDLDGFLAVQMSSSKQVAMFMYGLGQAYANVGPASDPALSYPMNSQVEAYLASLTASDKNGKAISNFSYTTASGQDYGLPNGTFVKPLYNVMPGFPWSKIEAAGTSGPFGNIQVHAPTGRLYVPVGGSSPHIRVVDIETMSSAGEIAGVNAASVAISSISGHGFSSSNPMLMWDANSLRLLKSIRLLDGVIPGVILLDPLNDFVYLFHTEAPLATVIRASDGSTVTEIALSGIATEAVTDGRGHVHAGHHGSDGYNVEVLGYSPSGILAVTSRYNLGGACSGLAMDGVNEILFATCQASTSTSAAVSSSRAASKLQLMAFRSGVPIPSSVFQVFAPSIGASFNSLTGEVVSLQSDGTMTIVKEIDPATYQEERYLTATSMKVKSLAIDERTGRVFYTGEQVSADLRVQYLYEVVK
jgi:hypothetical protein